MTDTAQLEKLIGKLVNKIVNRPTLTADETLWDEHDIASYFKYSLDYTTKHIMTNPRFPPARKLPTSKDNDRFSDRWKAADVIKYGMAFDKTTVIY